MKRLLYLGANDQLSKDLLKGLMEEHKPDLVVNVSTSPSGEFKKSGVLFYEVDFAKALYGCYDPVDSALSPKLLHDLSPYLLTTLKMMDRLNYDKVYRFDDRIQMYFNHVRYWSYILDEYKIDCFVSAVVPHEVVDYVIYSLCKIKGIKTASFLQTAIVGAIQFFSDIDNHDIRLPDHTKDGHHTSAFAEKIIEEMTIKYKQPFYINYFQKHINKQHSFSQRLKNWANENWSRVQNAGKYFKYNLKDFSLALYLQARYSRSVEKKLNDFYYRISCLPDYSKEYIYVPLHYQPECTTNPLGGIFVYQEIMIEILLNSLPEGFLLYIKEHPLQGMHGRTEDFYKKFINNPKVVWIRKEASSIDLIKNSKAIATVAGTAAWEALFQGKKALLFGKVFYQYAPGAYIVNETSQCKEALAEILRTSTDTVNLDALRDFLLKVEQNMVRGWTDSVYGKQTDISHQESLRNILIKLRDL